MAVETDIARRLFTRAEYYRMAEVGILTPTDRVELIRGEIKDAEPTTADVVLLIEVAETSIRYDRTTKLRLYAEAGVPEYWIVDCASEAVEGYRSASANGYADLSRVEGDGSIGPAALADVALPLREIFA